MTGTDHSPVTHAETVEAIETAVYDLSRERDHIAPGDAISINSGYCRVLVGRVLENLGRPKAVTTHSAGAVHSWIEVSGIHYDAERPAGVDHPSEFPIWDRLDCESRQRAIEMCDLLSPEQL